MAYLNLIARRPTWNAAMPPRVRKIRKPPMSGWIGLWP
jgi:hypothetical protein